MSSEPATEYRDLVRKQIEKLRPKLLDMSRRNPLLSTKFSARSSSHVRVIDELPDVLLFKIATQTAMLVAALPPLEEDPKDEASETFNSALANALLTDEEYLKRSDAIDDSDDDAREKIRRIQRDLKDRVRERVGLPLRQTKSNLSVTQHAKNNGIDPSFDLPNPDQEHEDGRHTDNAIQTLLLPDDLERKLNGLSTKCRTWLQDTGINVLHCAFGFLEWIEPGSSDKNLAPLILMPIAIQKERTPQGARFYLTAAEGSAELNAVLREKLLRDYGMEIPNFESSSVEDYVAELKACITDRPDWRVRRQVAIGVFPSARMAMYMDLDPAAACFDSHEIVQALLLGNESSNAMPFAEDYSIDSPEVEEKVPLLLMDADASQFSALVDLKDGTNLAVEGPPGSGKSQTIVNAIGAALAEGKKVLFVAEKLAALDVVKARLESIALGEFVLPLQASRSSREQVIQSVSDRIKLKTRGNKDKRDRQVAAFKQNREEINNYLEILERQVGDTGFTIHDVLGRAIKHESLLEQLPRELQRPDYSSFVKLNSELRNEIAEKCRAYEESARAAYVADRIWKATATTKTDRFHLEDLCENARLAAEELERFDECRADLEAFGIGKCVDSERCQTLRDLLARLARRTDGTAISDLVRALNGASTRQIARWLETYKAATAEHQSLRETIVGLLDKSAIDDLERGIKACEALQLDTVDIDAAKDKRAKCVSRLDRLNVLLASLNELVQKYEGGSEWRLSAVQASSQLIADTDQTVLALRGDHCLDAKYRLALRRETTVGLDLRSERNLLAENIAVENALDLDAVRDVIVALSDPRWYSNLLPSYRQAKKRYLKVSKRNIYEAEIALGDLRRLRDYLERVSKYLKQPGLSELFGEQYRGIDTSFEYFDQLLVFLDQVDGEIAGSDHATLRELLKARDLSLLVSVPRLEGPTGELRVGEAIAQAGRADEDLARFETAIDYLARGVARLTNAKNMSLGQLRETVQKAKALLNLRASLSGNPVVERVLGVDIRKERDKLRGLATDSDLIRLIGESGDLGRVALSLVEEGRHEQAKEKLANMLGCHESVARAVTDFLASAEIPASEVKYQDAPRVASSELRRASGDLVGLSTCAKRNSAYEDLRRLGFSWVVDSLDAIDEGISDLSRIVEAIIARGLSLYIFESFGVELAKYSGDRLEALRGAVATSDREAIAMANQELRHQLVSSAAPPVGIGVGRKSSYTEMALLHNEMAKKKRFVPVRDLVRRASKALLELKPCWMMSPLAVAQYIPQGTLSFDLCIIDEASQMRPEDALGALVRSAQCMIVGDTNQLPPTNFFQKMLDDEDEDDDENVVSESILEIANAAFRPARRLRWHYRSKHSSLIQFSNKIVYDGDLVIFPSAADGRTDLGVRYINVEGAYRSGTNPEEAKAMVQAAVDFMKSSPERSLGVVTLNQKQRDLLFEEMEYAIAHNRGAARYIESWQERNDGLEAFFIKNLENVQGDERDVIFIGTVYGPESPGGPVAQRFGPINGIAGRRRLNVLFTRAKEQIVTFSSMTANDITAEESGNAGVYMLKRWLEYSATGVLEAGQQTQKTPDSEFEEYVIKQITAMGCHAEPQVGAAGYFIDIGVKHPSWPHGYILAVECDGASYHSSKSARERDRLRQEVLERLGWVFHRIWSTDWFDNPRRESEKLRLRIESRLEELKAQAKFFSVVSPSKAGAVSGTPDGRDRVRPPPKPIDLRNAREQWHAQERQDGAGTDRETTVETGDEVRVRFLTGEPRLLTVTLSATKNVPAKGIVHVERPLGAALLGAQLGDEIDVLVGERIRVAQVEAISKSAH